MTEPEWLVSTNPVKMLRSLEEIHLCSDRKLTLFSVAIFRGVEADLLGPLFRLCIETAEAHTEGQLIIEDVHSNLEAAERESLSYQWPSPESRHEAARYACWAATDVSTRTTGTARLRDTISCVERVLQSASYLQVEPRDKPGPGPLEIAASLCDLLRDVFGNPFDPVTFLPEWRTDTVIALAQQMYDSRDFSAMPILADALMDAGCTEEAILTHCRGPGLHVRGCWCVDACLDKS